MSNAPAATNHKQWNMNHDINSVATIGFFDGVHRGHRFLIKHVMDEAHKAGLRSVVVTFDRHPRQVLQQEYQPELLTTLADKASLLQGTGIDHVEVLHFDESLASLTAFDFMAQVLKEKLGTGKLVIGYDNRFGHNRTEGFDDYVRHGKSLGIEVIHNPAFLLNNVRVSSSVVRSFLKEGEVRMAALCLGRPYAITGKVVGGHREGRKMGFPTANLDTSAYGLLVPRNGVYAVKARISDEGEWLPAMMNIGTRPTFNGSNLSLEANILDFQGDLYGKQLQVQFIDRVRDERNFKNAGALMSQLTDDEKQTRRILATDTTNNQPQDNKTNKQHEE